MYETVTHKCVHVYKHCSRIYLEQLPFMLTDLTIHKIEGILRFYSNEHLMAHGPAAACRRQYLFCNTFRPDSTQNRKICSILDNVLSSQFGCFYADS